MQLQTYNILFIWVFNTAAAYQLHQIVYGSFQNLPANNVPSAPSNTIVGGRNQITNLFGSANAQANTFSGIFRNPGNSNPSILGSFSNFQSHASSGGGNTFSNTISSHGTDRGGSSSYRYSSTGNSNFGASSSSAYGGQYQSPYKTSHPAIDCRSDVLSCVPAAECENDPYKGTVECPPQFIKLGGACYYFSIGGFVRERSAPDSRKFCEELGGHLLWLENDKEFESVSQVIGEKGNLIYWSDGFYNKRKDQWEWYNNTQKVDIRRLHYESYISKSELTSPNPNTQCLLVGSGIDAGYCYSQQPFVCKIGEFSNYCERSSLKKCCWSPSYEFYRTSRLGLTPVTIGSLRKSTCFVLFDMEIVKCEEAFKALGYSAFRVKKSIYYLKNADLGCGKDLEAVISSEDVSRNIVQLMMLRELRPFKVKIGLKFQPSTYSGSFVWSNGKSVDYYEIKHWGSGQPIIYGSSSCVMYQLTGTYGSYLWHTQSDSRECTHPNNYVLCELPIRNKKEEPVKKEEGCGIRKTRGSLARSFLGNHDSEEAKLGEMPWHVAIQRAVVHSGRVRQEFLCSGVLVSKNSILTSAHCVQGRQRELIVSLGENDLLAGSRRKILQPVSKSVLEVVIHPEYSAGKNDLAILQLSLSVDIPSLPHVSTTCLPDQQLLNTPGEWECLATGWQTSASYRQQVLHRIEVEFVSKQVCSRHTAVFSSSQQSDYIYYGQHKSNEPKLLCTEPWDSTTCLDDPTQILICKKATSSHRQDPFDSGRQFADTGYDHNRFPRGTQTEQYRHESTNILNSYGENRYNADKWYVIGLGYTASKCEGYNQISVFTPVHEFLAFIHASVDHTQRSPVIFSTAPKDYGFSFATELPVKIPEQSTEMVAETTIAPVTSLLPNLVSDGEKLALRLADLKEIEKVLGAVKAVFDLFKSAVKKYFDFEERSVINDIRRRRSVDTDIDSIVQKLTELLTGSQFGEQLFNEIEEIILSLENFIIAIEIRNVDESEDEIRKANEKILKADNDLTSMIKDNKEKITQVQLELDTINNDIRNLGGVIITVPQDDSTEDLVAAVETAKMNVEQAAKLFEKALAEMKEAEAAMKEADEAAKKAEEEAAEKAAEEEAAREAAEEAAEAARKEEEEAARKEAEEEAARKAEEAEKARLEKEAAEEKARLEKEAADKKAAELVEAMKKAEEAETASKAAEEVKQKAEEELAAEEAKLAEAGVVNEVTEGTEDTEETDATEFEAVGDTGGVNEVTEGTEDTEETDAPEFEAVGDTGVVNEVTEGTKDTEETDATEFEAVGDTGVVNEVTEGTEETEETDAPELEAVGDTGVVNEVTEGTEDTEETDAPEFEAVGDTDVVNEVTEGTGDTEDTEETDATEFEAVGDTDVVNEVTEDTEATEFEAVGNTGVVNEVTDFVNNSEADDTSNSEADDTSNSEADDTSNSESDDTSNSSELLAALLGEMNDASSSEADVTDDSETADATNEAESLTQAELALLSSEADVTDNSETAAGASNQAESLSQVEYAALFAAG